MTDGLPNKVELNMYPLLESLASSNESLRHARISFAERARVWLMVFAADESTAWQWGGAAVPAAAHRPATLAESLVRLRLLPGVAEQALWVVRELAPGKKIADPLLLKGVEYIYEMVAVRRGTGELQCTISNVTAHERLLRHFQQIAQDFLAEAAIKAMRILAEATLAELERQHETTALTGAPAVLIDQWVATYPDFSALTLRYMQKRTEQQSILRDSRTVCAPLPHARHVSPDELDAVGHFMRYAIPQYGFVAETGVVKLLNHAAQGEYADASAAAAALGIHESQLSVWRAFLESREADDVVAHVWAGGTRYRALQRTVAEGRLFTLAPSARRFAADPFEQIHALKGLGSYPENFPVMREAGFSAEDIREMLQAFVTGALCQLHGLAAIAERCDVSAPVTASLAELRRILITRNAPSRIEVAIPAENQAETIPMGVVTAIDLLLDNARRHGAAKRIGVHMRVDGNRMCVAVEDNGSGIPVERLTRLQRVIDFGRFDPEVTSGGHGYGVLTVARTALMLRNGSLAVASRPGCTRFVIAWDRA
ncbi:MAG: hypothetical protein EPN21_04375 [Methylococcaceae bacterium]|nr:MAG: hypothetical protein EPN21_04375 [Methylococcaceae bacterium]